MCEKGKRASYWCIACNKMDPRKPKKWEQEIGPKSYHSRGVYHAKTRAFIKARKLKNGH